MSGESALTGWINDITEAWARGAANTLSLGRLLSDARASLRYGAWSRLWCSGLPFSKRKGEMLVTIGQTLGGLDAQNSAQLPSAWNTIYCVARLGRPVAERLIEQGRVHPGLTLREARVLLAEFCPEEDAQSLPRSGDAAMPKTDALMARSGTSAQSSPRSLAAWVGVIRQAWARSPGNILDLARLVSQARASLRHGDWSKLWCSPGLPFSKKAADRLVTIGEALGAANETHCSHLPCAMRTLYHLARLGWPTVKRLLEQGRIHPGMTETEARALLAEFRPELAQKIRRSTVAQWLARVAASFEQKAASWSPEERTLAQGGLLRLAKQLAPGSDGYSVVTNPVQFQSALAAGRSNRIHPFPPIDIHSNHSMA